jgi:phosphoribosylglycinamide formyltransferase-1
MAKKKINREAASKSPAGPEQRKNVLGDLRRLKKLLELTQGFPELVVELAGEQHLAFKVRKKTLAWYLDSHHDDGIVCLCAKSTKARQQELIAQNPGRYFYPQYVGPSGWVSLRLDQPRVEWPEVLDLLVTAYRLQAPKKLSAELG